MHCHINLYNKSRKLEQFFQQSSRLTLGSRHSMEAFLRARGTPTSIDQLAKMCPRPEGVQTKFLHALANDERFHLHDLESTSPRMVQMRETPWTEADAAASVTTHRETMEAWFSRCFFSFEVGNINARTMIESRDSRAPPQRHIRVLNVCFSAASS